MSRPFFHSEGHAQTHQIVLFANVKPIIIVNGTQFRNQRQLKNRPTSGCNQFKMKYNVFFSFMNEKDTSFT